MPALDMNLGPGRFLRKCANIRDGRQASQVLQELRFSLGRSLCDVLQDLVDHETKEESGAEHALSKIAPILRLRWDPLIRGPMAWLEVEHYSCEALGFDQVNLNIERETYATKAPALNEVLFLACDAGATQHAYVTLNVQELMGTTAANTAFPGGDRTDNSGGPPSGPYKELFCLSASRICPRKDLPPIFVFISCPPGCRGRPLRPTGCGRLARTALCPTKTSGSAA